MTVTTSERRTAMYHSQLAMGATMADSDGWRLPLNYGDVGQETAYLRETVGISDVSPIGKVKVVGSDAPQAVNGLVPQGGDQPVGSVSEADSPIERGGKLLAACLAPDDFLVLTPVGVAAMAAEAMRLSSPACSYPVDVTSALCAVSLVGPATHDLLSRITDFDTSPDAFPDLTCAQSRFLDIQGLLLRRDVNGIPIYQLYAGREFGEYLWEALIETAGEVGGGPVGSEALLGLRDQGL